MRISFILICLELGSKALGLLYFLMLARRLGSWNLGLYSFAMTIANLVALAPKFGFERMVQRDLARNPEVCTDYFVDLSLLKTILSILGLVVLWIACLLARSQDVTILLLTAVFSFLYCHLEFISAFFRGLRRADLELGVRSFFSILNVSLGALLLHQGYQLKAVIIGQIFSVGVALMLGFAFLKPFLKFRGVEWRWDRLGEHLRAAAPFGAILVTLYLSNQLGVVVLAAFHPKEEVGYFAAAMKLFDSLTLVAAAVMGAFLPTMSDLHLKSNEAFWNTFQFTMKYLYALAAPICLGLWVLADPIVAVLFGTDYLPSAIDLKVLGLALVLSFWNYTLDSVLIAAGEEKRLFRLILRGALAHISANLLLVPYLSHLGASWAVLATQAVYFLLLVTRLSSEMDGWNLFRRLGRTTCSAVVMGIAAWSMREASLWLVIPTAAALYGTMLVVTRAARIEEFKGLERMIRRTNGASM